MLPTISFPVLAAAAGLQPLSPAPTIPASKVTTCELADGKSATVTRIGNRYTYSYGKGGRLEIRLEADPASNSAYKHRESFPRAGLTQLRFVNGATSYVLFHYFNLGNYVRDYEGATEVSGLLVLQNGRKIAGHLCRSGSGLEDAAELVPLPEDPIDLLDEIIDVAERKPDAIADKRVKRSR